MYEYQYGLAPLVFVLKEGFYLCVGALPTLNNIATAVSIACDTAPGTLVHTVQYSDDNWLQNLTITLKSQTPPLGLFISSPTQPRETSYIMLMCSDNINDIKNLSPCLSGIVDQP